MTVISWEVSQVSAACTALLKSLNPPYRIVRPCRKCHKPTHYDDRLCGECYSKVYPTRFRNRREDPCQCGKPAILYVELGINYHKEIVGMCLDCLAEEIKTLALFNDLRLDLVQERQSL